MKLGIGFKETARLTAVSFMSLAGPVCTLGLFKSAEIWLVRHRGVAPFDVSDVIYPIRHKHGGAEAEVTVELFLARDTFPSGLLSDISRRTVQ